MAARLIRWYTFTVAFALLPLITTLALRYMQGSLTVRALEDSPEVLFFALMVCATALGDIHELRSAIGTDNLLYAIFSILLLGVCASGILYGSLVWDKITTGGTADFQRRLLAVSIGLAIVFLALGTTVQVFVSRIEGGRRAA